MYEFNSEEILKFRSDAIFRATMERAFRCGMTKERALSELCMILLTMKDASMQEKIDLAINSGAIFPFSSKAE